MSANPSAVSAKCPTPRCDGLPYYVPPGKGHRPECTLMTQVLGTAVQAVIALHRPVTEAGVTYCPTCVEWVETSEFEGAVSVAYPCPTIQALTNAGIDVEVGS